MAIGTGYLLGVWQTWFPMGLLPKEDTTPLQPETLIFVQCFEFLFFFFLHLPVVDNVAYDSFYCRFSVH